MAKKRNPAEVVTEAAEHVGKSLGAKIAPLVPPWAAGTAMVPLAVAAHQRFGSTPWASVGMTLADVALAAVTWHYGSKRSMILRVHSTLTTTATTGWLTAAAIAGMGSGVVNIYLLGGSFLAASWNIKHLTRNFGQGEGADSDAGLFAKVGLARAKARATKVEANKVTVDLQLPRGELTAGDAMKARENIASALSLPAGGVRVVPNRDHHDRATVTLVPEDMLRNAPVFTEPSAPGGTMVDALVFGKYEDWIDAQIWAAANPKLSRNLAHLLLVGMTGAGKGVVARNLLVEILTRRECSVWAIDVVKRMQTLGCVAEGLDWFATSRAQAEAMIDCLPEVIAARTDYLAKHQKDNWEPGCGLNFLVVWIEEFASVLRNLESFVDTANAARSAGMWIVLSGQRVTHDNLPTSVRNAFGEVICLGVRDAMEASIALGDDLVAAGADPAAWQARQPGYAYVQGPGIALDRGTVPLRSCGEPFITDQDAVAAIVAQYAHVRDPLDPITATAAGRAYVQRGLPDAPAGDAKPARAGKTAAAKSAAADHQKQEESAVDDEEEFEPIPAEVMRHVAAADLPESPEPDVHAVARAMQGELPPVPVFRFDGADLDEDDEDGSDEEAEDPTTKAEAEAKVDEAIRAALAEGRTTITPADLEKALTGVRSRGWVGGYIKVLTTRRVLKRTGLGQYEIREVVAAKELAGV
jgi:hypothetical protein